MEKDYDISKQPLRGLTQLQYMELIRAQNFCCPISGNKFEYSEEQKKFLDVAGNTRKPKAPPIDHDHDTGFIRGILSEKLNFLLDQWERNSYGNLPKPIELTDYQNNPPAFRSIGRVQYKKNR